MKDKAIIFDMDGVIADTEEYHCKAWIETYTKYGIDIDKEYYFNKISGNHHSTSVNIVNSEFKTNIDPDTAALAKGQVAADIAQGKIKAVPFVVDFIKEMRKKGVVLGLATSSSFKFAKSVLETLGIEDSFKVIHSGECVKKGKPNPEIYLKTAKILNVKPENCVVIEDTRSGVESAKAAGMKCIGFLNGKNQKEQLAYSDFVINSFEALNQDLIKKIIELKE